MVWITEYVLTRQFSSMFQLNSNTSKTLLVFLNSYTISMNKDFFFFWKAGTGNMQPLLQHHPQQWPSSSCCTAADPWSATTVAQQSCVMLSNHQSLCKERSLLQQGPPDGFANTCRLRLFQSSQNVSYSNFHRQETCSRKRSWWLLITQSMMSKNACFCNLCNVIYQQIRGQMSEMIREIINHT